MKKWKDVREFPPPAGEDFWGYNYFGETVCICSWDGKETNDDGDPFPKLCGIDGNDYSVIFWMEKEPRPEAPNVYISKYDDPLK